MCGEKDFKKGFGDWEDIENVEEVIEEGRSRISEALKLED